MHRPLILLPTLLALSAFAADNERAIGTKLTEAKVYLGGAQVTRTASATLPAGTSVVVFTGLAQGLDPQSIQVTGKGGYQILSVNHRINYLTESPRKRELEELQARIKRLEKEHAHEKALQDVLVNEEQLLAKNSAIGGQQNGLTAAQLQAVNDYVRQRLTAIKTGWLAQQEKLNALQEELGKARAQQQQAQAEAPRPTSEVVVELSSAAEVSASFTVSYFVREAGWTPAYDLRAKGVGQPIELLMKAQVVNSTGEDWSKVALSLSSGNPTLGGVMPALHPWTLYAYQPRRAEAYARTRTLDADQGRPAAAPSAADQRYKLEEREASVVVQNAVASRATTMEFIIEAPFTIPADGKAHTVGVRSHSIGAQYRHFATPKLDKDAFLYARTTGWEELSLLPGEANVFFEGTYVGQSYLDLDQPKDTLDISLGRDRGVVIERARRKGANDKALIGSKRTVSIGWDITVRNTKGSAIDLELRDQYPLSPQGEIEVKLEDRGGAAVDEQRGALTWKIAIEPKGTRKVGFGYSVKHPKELPVVLE